MADATGEIAVPEILSYIEKTAPRFGVDPDTAKKLFLSENMDKTGKLPATLSADKTSDAGAYGLMQVMPATHAGLKKAGVLPPDHSMDSWTAGIDAGLGAIKDMQRQYKSNDPNVLAAGYQGGNNAAKIALAGDYDSLPPMAKDYQRRMTMAGSILGTDRPASPSQRDVRVVDNPIVATAIGDTRNIGTSTVDRAATNFADVFKNTKTIMDNLISEITSSGEAEAKAKTSQVVEIVKEGEAAAAEATARAAINSAASTSRARILKILNLDDNDANNRISENMARLNVLDSARAPLKDEIDARQAVGFFDNPIQYLANATILPGKIAQYNAIARDSNEAIERIDVAQRIAQTQESITIGASADQYAAVGVASANLATAKANAAAAEAKAQAASSTSRKVLGIAHLQAQIGGQALTSLQFEAIANARDEKIDANKELKAERTKVAGRIALLGTTIGAPNIGFQQWKDMPPKDREEWNIRMSTGRLGDSISESVPFILRYGDLRTMADTGSAEVAEVVKRMDMEAQASASVLQTSAMVTGEKKPKAFYMPAAYDIVQNKIEQERTGNMMAASDVNPYRANHATMATSWKGSDNNPVFKIVNDAVKAKLKVNDTVLFDAVTKQVDAGVLTPAEAASGFAEYYGEVAKRNNSNRALELLGLPKEKDYIVLPKNVGMRLNLMNKVDTENYMLKRVATSRATEDATNFFSNFAGQ